MDVYRSLNAAARRIRKTYKYKLIIIPHFPEKVKFFQQNFEKFQNLTADFLENCSFLGKIWKKSGNILEKFRKNAEFFENFGKILQKKRKNMVFRPCFSYTLYVYISRGRKRAACPCPRFSCPPSRHSQLQRAGAAETGRTQA